MEPAVNPALEAQAVGRVYRLGQRKSVQVIRMRIEDSIETRMDEMSSKKYGEAKKPDPEKEETTENGVAAVPYVGHIARDKGVSFAQEEFDTLFGV